MVQYSLIGADQATPSNSKPGSHEFVPVDIPDADVSLYPALFSPEEADELFKDLRQTIEWQQEKIEFYGNTHDVPRLTAWYGDANKIYTYSGIRSESRPWTASLLRIKKKIEQLSSHRFNSVLINLYRTGADSVAWHSDNEKELGKNPVIGSVSLGETRTFHLKHRTMENEKIKIPLTHGSYLLMKGSTQHHWLHQIPKSKKQMAERINLTFRTIV